MKHRIQFGLLSVSLAILSACDPVIDQSMVSTQPVSPQHFSEARKAAGICGDNAPNWAVTEQALKAGGYKETKDLKLSQIEGRQGVVILESPNSDTLVLLGSHGGEGACIIGSKGLTPAQSYELALPWVQKFNALSNEERGQGLAKNAVQAWGALEADRIVYIAAYKTWDVLDAPGGAARLLYVKR